MLTTVRQAPGGGRDLYASPDGNVYRRKDDGWYRRQAGGGWSFFAPTQGAIERDRLASARGAQPPAAGPSIGPPPDASGVRANAGAWRSGAGHRFQARAQEVAALERQYYARSLAQMRAQNWRPPATLLVLLGRSAAGDEQPSQCHPMPKTSISNQQFDRTRRLALSLAGIELVDRHRELLDRRSRRLGILDSAGLDALLGAAEEGETAATQRFLGLLTTKFTGFFRHPGISTSPPSTRFGRFTARGGRACGRRRRPPARSPTRWPWR